MQRRVVGSASSVFYLELERVHDLEVARALDDDQKAPYWSNTVEMLLRKGVKAYKLEYKSEK